VEAGENAMLVEAHASSISTESNGDMTFAVGVDRKGSLLGCVIVVSQPRSEESVLSARVILSQSYWFAYNVACSTVGF
jgi:hypothetical protein